jgi:hypothetical protein
MARRTGALRIALVALALVCGACGTATSSGAPPASHAAASEPASPAPAPGHPPDSDARADGATLQRRAPFGAITVSGDLARLRQQQAVGFLLHSREPERLLERYATIHPEARRHEQGVLMAAGALPAAIEARHRAPSFLVDFDQPAIAELLARLNLALDSTAGLDALRESVARQFETITYGTFWTASRAAKLRSGDCTEHAVVLAALARARGLPARVVIGYVMLSDGERGMALGHAWNEVHDGTRWQRVDATEQVGPEVAYLVIAELVDEGPGFARSLLDSMEILRVDSIEVVAPLDGAAVGIPP